jgi:hypothetical protein
MMILIDVDGTLAFMARIYADGYPQSLGIACNEYVATVIDENGVAYAYRRMAGL